MGTLDLYSFNFLVISCPCALVLSVPLAFFSGIGSGSKQGILFKGGLALEALKNIKTIVMDKTGTLTHGNFTVKTINPTNNYTKEELLSLCASCEKISSHPIAISIINEATKQKLNLKTTTDNQEIAGEGIICTIDKQKIYCGNKRLMQRFNITLPDDLPINAGTEIFIGIDGKYAGSIVIDDTIKDDAKSTIAKLKKFRFNYSYAHR